VTLDDPTRAASTRRGNSGRIPEGGILEIDPQPILAGQPRLLLREPDRWAATRIADAINATLGEGTAQVEDPGSIRLTAPQDPGQALTMLAAVDTVQVEIEGPARIVIHGKEGTIVAGGDVRVGSAVIHHKGITLSIGAAPVAAGGESPPPGFVQVPGQALVQDVAAGLHAAGAAPEEVAAIFEALADAGALSAEVVIR
jgi:flagellar P-ring protein precursor FlgI